MLRITSSKTAYRAAAVVFAAAITLSCSTVSRAAGTIDLLANDPTTPVGTPSLLTATSSVALAGNANGLFGAPGYTGTINVGLGALSTLSEGFTPNGASNSFYITQTGVAGAFSNTSATKSFGTILAPNTTYSFTLTRTTALAVALLGDTSISLTNNGTPFVNTATGTGLLGIVDLGILFGTNTTANFQFTTPPTLNASSNIGVIFASNIPAGVAGGSITFSSASITQVPEPRTTAAAACLGLAGLAALRYCRRARLA